MYPALASQFMLLMLATSDRLADLGARSCSTPPRSSSRAPSATSRSTSSSRSLYLALALRLPRSLLRAALYQLAVRGRAMIREFGCIDVHLPRRAPRAGPLRADRRSPSSAAASSALRSRCCASRRVAPLRWLGDRSTCRSIQGTPLLVWLFLFYFGLPHRRLRRLAVDRRGGGLLDLCRRLPRRDLARLPAGGPAHAVGGRRRRSASASLAAAALRHPAAGGAHRHPADRRLPGAAHQEHLARRGDRLRRADPRGPAHQRSTFQPLHRLSSSSPRSISRCASR